MLDKDLPGCICTAHNYRPGGASFGGNGSSQWFTCQACGRPCLVISRHMTVLIFPTEAVLETVPEEDRCPPPRGDGKSERVAFPQNGLDYVNGALDITMRTYGAAVEAARAAVAQADWALCCELLGIPHNSKIERTMEHGRHMQRPDGSKIEDPTILERFDKMRIMRNHDSANWRLIAPPTPPKVPACLTLFVYDGSKEEEECWRPVDHAESAALCVPPDPRRTFHDKRFGAIFAELRARGFQIQPAEIQNGYYDDKNKSQPWYEFLYGGSNRCKFTVGPRKKVISIEVESEGMIPTEKLRTLAKRDSVTYEADGGWLSGIEAAHKILIHAWTPEACVEYLVAAIESTL